MTATLIIHISGLAQTYVHTYANTLLAVRFMYTHMYVHIYNSYVALKYGLLRYTTIKLPSQANPCSYIDWI